MPDDLVDFLPERLERALREVTTSDEIVHIKLKGAFKEALVCTSRKIVIVKAGFMTENSFGANTFQLPYARIGGAEVKYHLLSGYFELSSSGVDNTQKSYWSQGGEKHDPKHAPNCVSITDRKQVTRFRAACDFILSFRPEEAVRTQPDPINSHDVVGVLERLGSLKDRGLLTDEEFQLKKGQLLEVRNNTVKDQHNGTPAQPDPNPDVLAAAKADAMISKYLAVEQRIRHSEPTKPVFGKRRSPL